MVNLSPQGRPDPLLLHSLSTVLLSRLPQEGPLPQASGLGTRFGMGSRRGRGVGPRSGDPPVPAPRGPHLAGRGRAGGSPCLPVGPTPASALPPRPRRVPPRLPVTEVTVRRLRCGEGWRARPASGQEQPRRGGDVASISERPECDALGVSPAINVCGEGVAGSRRLPSALPCPCRRGIVGARSGCPGASDVLWLPHWLAWVQRGTFPGQQGRR